ncbi:hypothetical protein B7R54_07220 [Subtercola boreus]|uniref:Single-stranded DNA-binding protein n=1 Tax=Subtercola boreus TaxID=120213 RepID=A0A3E0VHU1_9MICO|nr:hypothetical protein B7R54_07220 [Subtercola boreus]TQL53964.1 single-stranded DNA-binding protein [Subtercola boreus]
MDNQIWLRGRLRSDPVEMDGTGLVVAAFVLENEQKAQGKRGRPKSEIVPWCDVVCEGELASNVLSSVIEGDYVLVRGELRVHRLHPVDDARDSVMMSVRAESIGLDLHTGVTKPLHMHRN